MCIVGDFIDKQVKKGIGRPTILRNTKEQFPERSHAEIRAKVNVSLFIHELDSCTKSKGKEGN